MPDETEVCLAAVFLNKGKDVLTAQEFRMYVSLDLRWMQVRDADALMSVLIEKKLMTKTGEYVRAAVDTSKVNVPVAYRPSDDLVRSLRAYAQKQDAEKDSRDDVLSKLIEAARGAGMERGRFISECNRVGKRLDVSIETAALIILRDGGADVSPFIGDVRSAVAGR